MPNLCHNKVRFTGEPEAIEQIRQLFRIMEEKEKKEECGQLPDFIKDKQGYFFYIHTDCGEYIRYSSQLIPNIESVWEIAEHFKVDFTMEYQELSNMIYGRVAYEKGVMTETFFDDEDFYLF